MKSDNYLGSYIPLEVIEILGEYLKGDDYVDLAGKYTASRQTIERVCKGTSVLSALSQPAFVGACKLARKKVKKLIKEDQLNKFKNALEKLI